MRGRVAAGLVLAGLVLGVAIATSAGAQPRGALEGVFATPITEAGPGPADTGKPMLFDLSPRAARAVARPPGCKAALDCRVRIIGTIEKNGAVMLNATAWQW